MPCQKFNENRAFSPLVYILIIIFGSSSWINVCSVWMELPLMVYKLPEKWSLPSYLAVIVQVANVFPLLFGLYKRLGKRQFDEAPLIAVLIAFEAVCMALLALFWQKTAIVGGVSHSVALFTIFFLLSAVDCSTNIIFLPYMARFKPTYTTAYFIGMGVSALAPTVVGMIQGADSIEFGVDVYNLIICGWMILTLVSFCLINWTKFGKSETVAHAESYDQTSTKYSSKNGDLALKSAEKPNSAAERTITPHFPFAQYAVLLFITAWTCALMNGVLPSIQTYASMPYGQKTFHLAVALPRIANTIGCFVPFFLSARSTLVISLLTVVATGFFAYIMSLAVMSPNVVLYKSVAGPAICVGAWIFAMGLLAYIRTVIAAVLRAAKGNSEKRLFWCGVFTQLGSFIGAFVMFPLVSIYELFKIAQLC